MSVRERAMFCPQCGNPIPEVPVTTVTPAPQPPPEPRQQPDAAKGRIEKLRHVSSVVIDQAAYDPSLRFLLVAAAFFILFLVLLILSKFIG